jgi:hypothetical protein
MNSRPVACHRKLGPFQKQAGTCTAGTYHLCPTAVSTPCWARPHLQNVVLNGACQLLRLDARLLCCHHKHCQHGQHRPIHGHADRHLVQGDAIKQDLHVFHRVHGHARHAHVAADAGMVRVVTPVCGQVKGYAEAHGACCQVFLQVTVNMVCGWVHSLLSWMFRVQSSWWVQLVLCGHGYRLSAMLAVMLHAAAHYPLPSACLSAVHAYAKCHEWRCIVGHRYRAHVQHHHPRHPPRANLVERIGLLCCGEACILPDGPGPGGIHGGIRPPAVGGHTWQLYAEVHDR